MLVITQYSIYFYILECLFLMGCTNVNILGLCKTPSHHKLYFWHISIYSMLALHKTFFCVFLDYKKSSFAFGSCFNLHFIWLGIVFVTFSDISNKIDGFGWMTEKIQISNNISTCKFYQIENATLIDEDKFYIFKSVISERLKIEMFYLPTLKIILSLF